MDWRQSIGEAFGLLCGRNPDHSWMVGGEQFPLCQRCAGIYAGAALAVVLDLLLRPRRGRTFLALHVLFIAQIAPLGLGLLENGAFLRSLSGWLFGLGLVGLLRWAAAPAVPPGASRARTAFYFAGAALGAAAVPLAGRGGAVAARLLAFCDLLGILALLALVISCALPRRPVRRGSLPGIPATSPPGPAGH